MDAIGARTAVVCFSLTVIALLLFATPGEAEIDPNSIVGLWLFDEGKGNETEDSSGNRYHGDIEGDPKWVDGQFGKALEFKGVEYIEIQNSAPNLSFGGIQPFTIAAWVKHQGGGYVVSKFNRNIIGEYIFSIGGGGTVGFHREVDPWGLSGTKALPFGDFGHAAVTYDGSEMKIYVNGELDVTQKRPAQNTDTVTPVLIGGRLINGNPDPDSRFRGVLDEVVIFNVALTEEQIQEVMKGLSLEKAVSVSGKLASTWGGIKVE